MKIWNGEVHGNTFLLLYGDDDRCMQEYLELRKREGRWDFDSALILSEEKRHKTVTMRVHEYDGTESVMCGNGILAVRGLAEKTMDFKDVFASGTIADCERNTHGICSVGMKIKRQSSFWASQVVVPPQFVVYEVCGEPHAVALVKDVFSVPLSLWGGMVVPYANCTVVSRTHAKHVIHARTFERGVLKETDSCGTGACAAAYALCEHALESKNTFRVKMHNHTLVVDVDICGSVRLHGRPNLIHALTI